MAAPDDGLAGVVDAVGERVTGRDGDPRDRAGQREGDVVERVVVVVADDHTPGATQPAVGTGGPRPLDGLRHPPSCSGSSTARGPDTADRAAWRAPSRQPRSPHRRCTRAMRRSTRPGRARAPAAPTPRGTRA